MIIDLARFVEAEEPHWRRLEQLLTQRQSDPWAEMTLEQARELDYLYRRAAADLARIATFSAEPEMRRSLEQLVARAYAEIHGARGGQQTRFRPWHWVSVVLPQTMRRHARAGWLTIIVTLVGVVFGGVAIAVDPEAKEVIVPFGHLLGDPKERVAEEERMRDDELADRKATFAGYLMTHNIRVTLFAVALGMTWGIGTFILLFYNGVILGAVAVDYVLAGESTFLLGWLLPHGIIEIPAIFVGAQAGLVLARAVVGREDGRSLVTRLRAVVDDVATLVGGAALMLVWAGVVEAYLSQYHEPAIPYALKIAFGVAEGAALIFFVFFVGRGRERAEEVRGG